MRISGGNFFGSAKADFLSFVFPIVPVLIAYAILSPLNLMSSLDAGIVFLLGTLLLDEAHIYTTLNVTYFDKERRREKRFILFFIPLLFLTFSLVALFSGNKFWFWRVLGMSAAFHFCRQQYGWMKLSHAFQKTPNWLRYIDLTYVYTLTFGLLAWIMTTESNPSWFQDNDLPKLPDYLSQYVPTAMLIMASVFLIGNLYLVLKTREVNLSKWMIALVTTIVYAWPAFFESTKGLSYLLIITHHGVPYFVLVFKKQKVGFLKIKKGNLAFLAFYIMFVIFVAIELGMFRYARKTSLPWLATILIAVGYLPQFTHYWLDAFIWRRNKKGPITGAPSVLVSNDQHTL